MRPLGPDHLLRTLPNEIWTEIFIHTASIGDATAWAEACDVIDLHAPLRALTCARAPGLLAQLPTPDVHAFEPVDRTSCPPAPDLGTFSEGDDFFGEEGDSQATAELYQTTQFLLAFAPKSMLAVRALERATVRWMFYGDLTACASLAENEIACRIEWAAKRCLSAVAFDLALGPSQFPPYLAGLQSVRAVLLRNLGCATDLSALLALPNLDILEIDDAAEGQAVKRLEGRLPAHIELIDARNRPSIVEGMIADLIEEA